MKMYVLVLNCLEYAIEHCISFYVWNNETIVYLGVRNPVELTRWKDRLLAKKKLISCFREPDLFNMLTDVACYDDGKIFNQLPF